MPMRLVQLDGEKRVKATAVPDTEAVLGRRAPEADVVVAHERVSRRHAMIAPYEDRHSLRDLESANGTRVNGYDVTTAVLLTPGDVIELGDVSLVYEEGTMRPPIGRWLALAAGVGVALAIGLAAVQLWPGGELDEAVALAGEALTASRAGDAASAKKSLNVAVNLLLDGGYLDDFPPPEARLAGLDLLSQQLDGDVDLRRVYESAVAGARATARAGSARQVAERDAAAPRGMIRRGPCRTDRVAERDLGLCIRERAEQVLEDLWQESENIPESFYEAVEEQFRLVLTRRRGWVEDSLARGRKLRPMIDAELEAAKMPGMLRYLSMIESGYQTDIRSKAGARGLWQFMPRTGRAYGLRITDTVDERTDPAKSTRAAAQYLRNLAFEFGGDALLLAIASYNKGENGIRRALKKLDDPRTDRSYWTLVQRGLLPQETQDYVPRLVAAAIMGEAGVPPESVLPPS